MTTQKWQDSTLVTLMNTGATLATATRKAADHDNGADLDPYGDLFLTVQYVTTAPAAGAEVAQLWLLPSDRAATPLYPEGGDGTVGTNVDPQAALLVGSFESRNPSTSATERLALPFRLIPPGAGRYVLKNVSGQTFAAGWTLTMRKYRVQSV